MQPELPPFSAHGSAWPTALLKASQQSWQSTAEGTNRFSRHPACEERTGSGLLFCNEVTGQTSI